MDWRHECRLYHVSGVHAKKRRSPPMYRAWHDILNNVQGRSRERVRADLLLLVLRAFAYEHLLIIYFLVIDILIVSIFVTNPVMTQSHDQRVRFILLSCRERFIQGKNTLCSFTSDLCSRRTLICLD